MKAIHIQNNIKKFSDKHTFLLVVIVLLFVFNKLSGQQLPRFSQYMMNEFIVNPSMAGNDGTTTIGGIARKEWMSFEGSMRSPANICFSAQTRFLKTKTHVTNKGGKKKLKKKSKGRIGLGGTIYADNSGALTKTSAQLAYAYHLTFNNAQLSFGLAGSMSQLNFNSEYIEFYDSENEPMQAVTSSSSWIPDFNAGISFSTHRFKLGVSTFQLLESPIVFGNSDINYSSSQIGLERSWNVLGAAYISPEHSPWMLEPSFLLKITDLLNFSDNYYAPTSQLDVSLRMFYDSRYWFGLSYRTMSEFVLMGGMKINKYYFAYAFDYGFNELSSSSFGSHEISFAIKFGDSARRYNWLDRY